MAALRLLVVEDDAANLELMTELLKQVKAEVCAVQDSREAAGLIQREKFDGILLDLTMPVLSGFDLARLVRESLCNKSTPIIVVTGQDEKDTMHSSFSLGATYFLQKPVDSKKLTPLLLKIQERSYDNRRNVARVALNIDVSCVVGDKMLSGQTWNISQGGIQLEVVGLQLGDSVQMSFILPQAATVTKAQGFVVWSQEGRCGLYFTDMGLEDQEAIRTYILRG
jgi:CheY-like chemotaxis protein